jgi:hypothetical protein
MKTIAITKEIERLIDPDYIGSTKDMHESLEWIKAEYAKVQDSLTPVYREQLSSRIALIESRKERKCSELSLMIDLAGKIGRLQAEEGNEEDIIYLD